MGLRHPVYACGNVYIHICTRLTKGLVSGQIDNLMGVKWMCCGICLRLAERKMHGSIYGVCLR